MGRKHRPRRGVRRPVARPLDPSVLHGVHHSEVGGDGLLYQVQRVGPSERVFTCPACRRPVGPGVEHVVAWPEEAPFGQEVGVKARRHWHSECWRRKLRPL